MSNVKKPIENPLSEELFQLSTYDGMARKTQEIRLIENSGFNNLVSLVMAFIWVALVWGKLPTLVLSVWLSMMVVLFACCSVVQYFKLYEKNDTLISAEIAKRWYFLALIFVAMGWGIASTLMFPYKEIEQITLAFILVGVAASGIGYSSVTWVYTGFVGFVLLPLAARLLYVGGEIYYTLSGMTVFLLGAIVLAAYRINKFSTDALMLSLKNEDLINDLSKSSKELEDLNRSLTGEIEYVKNIEEELKNSRDHAEKMSRTKDEFLANMSHEIRTPMNGVIGTLQLLEDTDLNESQSEYLAIAVKSADSLMLILNDILDLSKIEAGKLEFEAIPFDLRETIKDVVNLHLSKSEQKGIYLQTEIDDGVPEKVIGDPTRVRQVMVNLISNAIKFTSEGGVKVRIKLKLKDKKDALIRVEVEDTGIGVAEDKYKKLFEVFSQADGSTTREHGGSGLGLAIVRQLVKMMNGNLGVESELGKGSKFWFVIPLEIADEKALLPASKQEKDEPIMFSARILLVEDNPINQMVAEKMLEKMGIKSVLANNGEEALLQLEYGKFDAVLMDCQMPIMDGFEATRIWREQEELLSDGRLPIIAMTANVMEGDEELCLSSGMDAYLGKPVRLSELADVLKSWIKPINA